jgi:hypothetical protein
MTDTPTELLEPNEGRAPKSTGPRTPQGKRRSRHNAVRHGIFADMVLTSEPFRESTHDYDRLLEALVGAIKPKNALQQTLVEMLAFEFLRLSRIYKVDAQIAPRMFENVQKSLAENSPSLITEYIDRKREIIVVQKQLDPELLLRYGSVVSKHIHRILDRLEPG